jgi:hypothetical protein
MHPLPNDNALTRRARQSGVLRFMHKQMLFPLPAAWARKTCINLLVKYGLSGGASKSVGGSEVGGLMQQPQGPSLFLFFLRSCTSVSHISLSSSAKCTDRNRCICHVVVKADSL